MIQKHNRIFLRSFLSISCLFCLWLVGSLKAYAEEPVVVVIDPGHGGENLGADYEGYVEKDMTMAVATAMKEELEKYDGIRVYMTRDGDIAKDMSLEARSAYAASVDADFMFCLHFNMSEEHTLFGSECWVSAFGEEYSKGYSFASVEMELLQEMGLYSRGIKTRLNSKGTDYYGILRTATEKNIPCVLIEHCHLDYDKDFYDHDEKLKDFGKLDATAVAKYFHLRSEKLGVDYSDYETVQVPVPTSVVKPDSTEPDVCMIEVLNQNTSNGEVTVQVSAMDYDSGMLYYAYSYDNGVTFSGLQPWGDKNDDTITFTVQIPPGIMPQIVVNAYNGYDLYTTSNMVSLPSMDYKTEDELAEELAEKEALESAAMQEDNQKPVEDKTVALTDQATEQEEKEPASLGYFLMVCGVCALIVLGMVFSVMLILRSSARRRRRRQSYHRTTSDRVNNGDKQDNREP